MCAMTPARRPSAARFTFTFNTPFNGNAGGATSRTTHDREGPEDHPCATARHHRPSAVGKIAERTDAALVAGSVDDSTV